MKVVERIAVIIFSIIILIVSIFSVLLVLGWASLDFVNQLMVGVLNDSTVYNTILVVAAICIILALKCIFFSSNSSEKEDFKTGVLLENEDGKLIISRDTIENLVSSVTKKFDGAAEVQTRVILDQENNITINVTLLVKENAIIKDLSANIQTKVKETIKRTSDLDVKQINIRVKNIEINKKDTIKRLEPPKMPFFQEGVKIEEPPRFEQVRNEEIVKKEEPVKIEETPKKEVTKKETVKKNQQKKNQTKKGKK